MRVSVAENVLQAYQRGVMLLQSDGALVEETRAGEARVWPEPVVTVTAYPERCVLLDRGRRANPFFHMYEALWMLCGEQDSRKLDRFVSNFSERFGESDGRQHGAYGWRWRQHFSIDQISVAVHRLRANPLDRRVVIAMWDPFVDSFFPAAEHVPADIPCNTHIYPRITDNRLSLTICCRSNDAVWGAHGANAVHFSFLLQYMAALLDVDIGPMYQLSNNYHMYTATAKQLDPNPPQAPWEKMLPLVTRETRAGFLVDAARFIEDPEDIDIADPWIRGVARQMMRCHDAWRERRRELFDMNLSVVACPVWRMAAEQWWPDADEG